MPRGRNLTILLSTCLAAGCGAPSGSADRSSVGPTSAESDENEPTEEEDDYAFEGGMWAPRGSLARVEEIPRAGKIEERPSRTGAIRVIALMPVDGTGNHIVEIVGLPALDRQNVVAALRGAHDAPRWAGCGELTFIADGEAQVVDDARHDGAGTALGVREAIRGRLPLVRLEAAANAETLVVSSCENEYAVARGPALLRDFVARFAELTANSTSDSDAVSSSDEGSDEGADAGSDPDATPPIR